MQDWEHLGRCIARDRKRKQWLQPDLARAAGLTKRTISGYESGRPPASAPDIPAGYYAVGLALGWPADGVELSLAGDDPSAVVALGSPATLPQEAEPLRGPEAIALYPAVVAFGRACVREGASTRLRDAFEEAAERLLQSIPAGRSAAQDYGLAAYRPHAWSEGETGVPADDAAAVERAIEEYRRGTPGR